jgi:hypothetical protein
VTLVTDTGASLALPIPVVGQQPRSAGLDG